MRLHTFFRVATFASIPVLLGLVALTAMGIISDPHATFPGEPTGVFLEPASYKRVDSGFQISWAVEDECDTGGYDFASQPSISAYENLEDVDWGGGGATCKVDSGLTRCSEVFLDKYLENHSPYYVQVGAENCVNGGRFVSELLKLPER